MAIPPSDRLVAIGAWSARVSSRTGRNSLCRIEDTRCGAKQDMNAGGMLGWVVYTARAVHAHCYGIARKNRSARRERDQATIILMSTHSANRNRFVTLQHQCRRSKPHPEFAAPSSSSLLRRRAPRGSRSLARDPQARFFYAVTTTGVFCRPSCASRRPLRANVRFFRSAAEAQAAGFRPCKRCRPSHCMGQPFGQDSRPYRDATSTGTCVSKSSAAWLA